MVERLREVLRFISRVPGKIYGTFVVAEELMQSVACFRGVPMQICDATRPCPSHDATLLRNCPIFKGPNWAYVLMSNKVAEIETVRPDRSVWRHEGVKANQLVVSVQK